jgi:DNA modification methylase
MIEIEPIYAEVILARWEKFTGQKAQKISEK